MRIHLDGRERLARERGLFHVNPSRALSIPARLGGQRTAVAVGATGCPLNHRAGARCWADGVGQDGDCRGGPVMLVAGSAQARDRRSAMASRPASQTCGSVPAWEWIGPSPWRRIASTPSARRGTFRPRRPRPLGGFSVDPSRFASSSRSSASDARATRTWQLAQRDVLSVGAVQPCSPRRVSAAGTPRRDAAGSGFGMRWLPANNQSRIDQELTAVGTVPSELPDNTHRGVAPGAPRSTVPLTPFGRGADARGGTSARGNG
jgi:hypothetical protein